MRDSVSLAFSSNNKTNCKVLKQTKNVLASINNCSHFSMDIGISIIPPLVYNPVL
jgi:hypothetical protein